MKKLVVFGAGVLAAGSVALLSAGAAVSDPVDTSAYNVVGEPYGKAVAILKNMGVKATFGGSRGSALPQAECLVDQQKVTSSKMLLMLDCTAKAAEAAEAAEAAQEAAVPGAPTVGSNGVTTVTPTPVGPQPGMAIPVG